MTEFSERVFNHSASFTKIVFFYGLSSTVNKKVSVFWLTPSGSVMLQPEISDFNFAILRLQSKYSQNLIVSRTTALQTAIIGHIMVYFGPLTEKIGPIGHHAGLCHAF